MHQHYDPTTQTYINTDEQGIVRGLTPEAPAVSKADTPQDVAQEYLEQHAELRNLQRRVHAAHGDAAHGERAGGDGRQHARSILATRLAGRISLDA